MTSQNNNIPRTKINTKFCLNLGIVYKESIKKMLKTPLPYIALIVSILVCLISFILLPIVTSYGQPIDSYYEKPYWVVITMQGSWVTFALVGALIGETNAIPNEQIYFLSKPLKRSTFLIGKCLSSLTISICIALVSLFILFGVAISEGITWKINIFTREANPFSIFGSYLIILIFASCITTVWRYQTKGGIWLIACFSLVLIYIIIYPMLQTKLSDNDDPLGKIARFWWLLLPIIIFTPLTIIGISVGSYVFMKQEIES